MRRLPLLSAALLTLAVGATACSASASNSSPQAAGTHGPVAGTVTVKAGNKVVCVMTIKGGKGTCKVSTAQYAAGTLKFVATYGGGPGYKQSGASASVRLLKATSKTSVTMSASRVTYGIEQSERIAVRVAPQYSAMWSTVTVRAGSAVVCVITLASGAGACALTAKKLAPGSYHVGASYPGTTFAASASASASLVVAG